MPTWPCFPSCPYMRMWPYLPINNVTQHPCKRISPYLPKCPYMPIFPFNRKILICICIDCHACHHMLICQSGRIRRHTLIWPSELFTIIVLFVIVAFVLPLPYLARILSSNILTSLWSCAGWFYKCLTCSETPKMGFSPKSGNLCAATTKCTDQTMRKHMLICAFAVCIWQNKFCLLKSELSSSETRGCVLEQDKLISLLIFGST